MVQVGRAARVLARRVARSHRRQQYILDALLQLLGSAVLFRTHAHELRIARMGRIVAPTLAHLLAVALLILVHEALLECLELLFVFHSCTTFHTGEHLLHARDQSVETLLARMQLAQVADQRVARIERMIVQQTPDSGKRHAAFPVQQHLMQPVDFSPLAASKSGIFPKMFVEENKNGSPSTSLLWTTIVVQVVLIISFFIGNNAWTTMISITSVIALPCYFFCTLFLFKIAVEKGYPSGIFASRGMAVFTGAAGSLYGLWLIYAAGLNYLMVACIVHAIGLPLYIVGVRQHDPKAKLFEKRSDRVILAVVLALGIAGLIYSVITFGNIHI